MSKKIKKFMTCKVEDCSHDDSCGFERLKKFNDEYMQKFSQCSIKDCKEKAHFGIHSFDGLVIKEDTHSEIIPYCDIHIEQIKSGKLKERLHQEFFYLNYKISKDTKKYLKEDYSSFDHTKSIERVRLGKRIREIIKCWELGVSYEPTKTTPESTNTTHS